MWVRIVRVAMAIGLLAVAGESLEGKWTPAGLRELDPAWLKLQGLEIGPVDLWDEATGSGLLAAVVEIDGCSAALVSPEGVLLTNHHCAFPALQQQSRPGTDLISDGFLASTRAAELPATGIKALVPRRFTDVTADIRAAAAASADDRGRAKAIERKQKELVAACEKAPGTRCRVAAFDDGLAYTLVESLEYPDVRLVWAPPRAVADFGGEVDNWMWPRHAGDFALLRVYGNAAGAPARPARDNVPLRPRSHLRLSSDGVRPGSFVVAAGYPGRTYRSLTAPEMGERAALYFPLRAEVFGRWLEIVNAAGAKDEDARLALAERAKSLANSEKNARGQVAGLTRGALVERKWVFEDQVLRWAAERPEWKPAIAAHHELAAAVEARRATYRRDFLLESMRRGPLPLDMALTLVRWARERARPDIDRKPAYMERNRDRLRERIEKDQAQIDEPTERALLIDLMTRFATLPEGSRSVAVDRFLGGSRDPRVLAGRVETLLGGTRVLDLAARRQMFDDNVAGLRLRRDLLIDLAFALDEELLDLEARREREDGAVSRLRPEWLRAVRAYAGAPAAPDANGTLRVTFGRVQGYAPRDAVDYGPQTRLAGLVEKVTGQDPFVAPPALLRAAALAETSRWADRALGDVPVAFLADLDTTGGNSGSPILNGRGELVGLNFDRVWENVANDFGYDPAVNRNVSVDVRYLGWVLETLGGAPAAPLLRELGFAPR